MNYILDVKTVIAADLDGTLTASKTLMTSDMAETLSKWLETNRFAIISGAAFSQFEKQVLAALPSDTHLENLALFPTNGASCYLFKDGKWTQPYEKQLTDEEKEKITSAIKKAVLKSGLTFDELFGEQIGYREGQITFSGLGQDAPLEKKLPWDPDQQKRKNIVSFLAPLLPNFNIGIGGASSIDITPKGIDKAYAISKIKEILNVENDNIIFFGDAIFEGGNDFPATKTGVTCIKVTDEHDTKKRIEELMSTMR